MVSLKAPFFLAATLLLGGITSGCHVRAYSEPAYVEPVYYAPPPNIEVYPHTYYEGRVVYLVDGRWYTRHGSGWVYYRREPDYLQRERVRVVAAPRAYAPSHRVAPAAPRTHVAPRAEPRMAPQPRGPHLEPRSAPPARERVVSPRGPHLEPRSAPRSEPRMAPRSEPRMAPRGGGGDRGGGRGEPRMRR